MSKIVLNELNKEVFLAAITGHCQAGENSKNAVEKSLNVIRELQCHVQEEAGHYLFDLLTKLQQLEEKIGVKVPDEKRCHVQQALDNGHSIEKIIELNPELVTA